MLDFFFAIKSFTVYKYQRLDHNFRIIFIFYFCKHFYFFSIFFYNMFKLNRWWSKQLNKVLTCLPIPYHSSICTSFSPLHSCFPMFFFPLLQFSIMFLVKFRKRSFLGRLNYHQYVFGSGILLDTVFLHSLCVLFCRPGMSWSYIYFAFLIEFTRNSDSLQLIRLF